MITTIIFAVSFCVLCGMIFAKAIQTKMGMFTSLSVFFEKGDVKIHEAISLLFTKYMLYKKIMYLFIFDFIPAYTYELLSKMKDYVARKYYVAGDQFRGRRVLRTNGSVSFFLERLTEDKSEAHGRQV